MGSTNLRDLLERLTSQGCTQGQIAAATGVKQSTISRILSGQIADPRHSVGRAIESFYARHMQDDAAA